MTAPEIKQLAESAGRLQRQLAMRDDELEECRAMCARLKADRDSWERRARELETLCEDRL